MVWCVMISGPVIVALRLAWSKTAKCEKKKPTSAAARVMSEVMVYEIIKEKRLNSQMDSTRI